MGPGLGRAGGAGRGGSGHSERPFPELGERRTPPLWCRRPVVQVKAPVRLVGVTGEAEGCKVCGGGNPGLSQLGNLQAKYLSHSCFLCDNCVAAEDTRN